MKITAMELKLWETTPLYKTEIEAILWAANEVHSLLGNGFFERTYHEALEEEFKLKKIPYEREAELKVAYKNRFLPSHFIADFLCFGKIVVELRVVDRLTREHRTQLKRYLRVCSMNAGLVLNFGTKTLQVQKYFRTPKQ